VVCVEWRRKEIFLYDNGDDGAHVCGTSCPRVSRIESRELTLYRFADINVRLGYFAESKVEP